MTSVISVKNLEVQFAGCDALCGVDLEVSAGKVVAILGENGAGKTTLIRTLTGFHRPTRGECFVLGLNPERDVEALRRRIGYVSDVPALYDWMRVDEIGWFAASFYQPNYLQQYRDRIEHYKIPFERKIKHLSKGQDAKVALALALSHDPELLILDEPTSGLDPLVRREFLESMLDRVAIGRTVLLSSHQISDVERIADEIAILHEGKLILYGALQELREACFEVTVSTENPLAAFPAFESPADVLYEEVEGYQHRWIIRGFTEAMRTQLASLGHVTNVRVQNASLDELFLACTRGKVLKGNSDGQPRSHSASMDVA